MAATRPHDWNWHLARMAEGRKARNHYIQTKAKPQQRDVDSWSVSKRKLCYEMGYAKARGVTPAADLLYLDDE
jgi:hypothetical protein